MPPPVATLRRYPRIKRISPDYSDHPSDVPCPLPRRIERLLMSITSPLTRPSPNGRRVGIRIVTFEACSGFTRVTARRIAQLPKATFVTRLQPLRLPARAARQLPDQSTTLRVESSSTGNPRLRGALPKADSYTGANRALFDHRVWTISRTDPTHEVGDGVANLVGAILLEEMAPFHGHFGLVQPGAAKFPLPADQNRTWIGIDEKLRDLG